jgi:type IV pilus assembly protein PilW
MHDNKSQYMQRGFSLVELMVALLLGVVLTSGVISVFITSKSSYGLNNAVGQVQEGGRYALTTMEPIVSMAGFSGCVSSTSPEGTTISYENILNGENASAPPTDDPVYYFAYPIYGFEFTGTGIGGKVTDTGTPVVDTTASDWSPSLSSDMTAAFAGAGVSPVKYSDMLMVHEELGNPAVLTGSYDDGTTLTYYASTTTPLIKAGDIAVASSCRNIEAFQVSGSTESAGANGTILHAGSGTPGNGTAWDQHFNNSGGNVGKAQTYLFFVGKGADGGYSLYEASLTSGSGQLTTVQEIVPGVENMQVLYGVNTNSNGTNVATNYQTADTITAAQWPSVVSVRIALMVRSDDDAIDKSMTPTAATGTQMLGVGFSDAMTYYPAADRRIHRYFVETISLRNSVQ